MKAGRIALVLGVALFISLIVGVAMAPWGPSTASEKTFDVGRAQVRVSVLPDARLEVTERLRYRFSDHSFSGAYRDIAVQSTAKLSGFSVRDAPHGSYRPGAPTALGSAGPKGSFGVTPIDGGTRVVWHYGPQQGGDRDFELRYRAQGAAEAYDDVVLVHWAVWGDQWQFTLPELEASLQLAEPATGDGRPIRTWLRPGRFGEPAGDGALTSATAERIPKGTQVVLSALYPRSAFRSVDGAVVRDGNGREAIIAREDGKDEDGTFAAIGSWLWEHIVLISGLLVLLIAALLARAVRAAREAPTGVPEHLPEPPEAVSPATAYGLATEGGHHSRVVLATLLGLVDRGWYTASAGPADPDDAGDDQLDLVLGIAPDRPQTPLGDDERAVRDFFDELIGEEPGSLSSLKDRIPEHDASWRKRWETMNKALERAAEQELAWDEDRRAQRWLLMGLSVVIFGVLAAVTFWRAADLRWPLIGLVFALAILSLPADTALRRMTPAVRERQARWAAFSKWTKDFPRLHDDPPATLLLWKQILVYGVAFGTAQKVIESGRIPANVMAEAGQTWFAGTTAGHYAFIDSGKDFGSSFGSGFSSQVAAQSSSGAGGGGGGGGSSGGGGGGAW